MLTGADLVVVVVVEVVGQSVVVVVGLVLSAFEQ